MKQSLVAVLVGQLVLCTTSIAATIKVSNQDIELGGGITGSFVSSSNTDNISGYDMLVSDALLEISSGKVKKESIGFKAAIGSYSVGTLYDGAIGTNNYTGGANEMLFPFNYGWVSASPMKNLLVDIGVIATSIGYESGVSYSNGHILRGMLWNAQPGYYRGVRASYSLGDISLFTEFNKDSSQKSSKSIAFGVTGEVQKISFSGTYSYGDGGNDIIDIVASTNVNNIEIGSNIDLYILEKPAAGESSSAVGVAVYVSPTFDKYEIPLRLEFTNNGDGPAYSYDTNSIGGSAYSFTITPTMHMSKNSFIRTEVGIISTDEKIFTDSDGVKQNLKMSLAIQAGYKF
ncbi:MAG: porin [Gammaproteobacteria bacterium]|nr:porin [Gammaproteobacteria bacterium]